MNKRVFGYTALTASIFFALMLNVLPPDRMHGTMLVFRFIKHLLPMLAVAALLKYLLFDCGKA